MQCFKIDQSINDPSKSRVENSYKLITQKLKFLSERLIHGPFDNNFQFEMIAI